MRLPPHLSRLAIAFIAALSVRAGAQAKAPQLRAVQDLRVDQTTPTPNRSAAFTVGPSGEMLVASGQLSGAIRGFDSTGKPLSWSVPFGNNRDLEIRWVWRMGWTGNSLWVADPGFKQIALIDGSGKVTKSLEYPSWVRPAWADRRKFPVFAGLEPLALYADGSWLVRPSNERSLVSTPEYDNSYSYLVRMSEGGSIEKVIARIRRGGVPPDPRVRSTSQAIFPAFGLPVWDASTDGSRVVVVSTALTGADSATYRVTAIGARGDTVFSKQFPFVPVAMSKQSIDSVRMRYTRSLGDRASDAVREEMMKRLPWAYRPIEGVLMGRDQTVWIELRSTAPEHLWLVLDTKGEAIGSVRLPSEFVARVAERGRVWGFDREADRVTALVRYRIEVIPTRK
jgi:hypothetical protein